MTDWTLHIGVKFDASHQPYSPDMAPSDYQFSHLQLHLDSTISPSNDEVINDVDRFLDSRTQNLFTEGIEKLSEHWQTTVDLNGDYYTH
ncbi:histone-lysine N-methyltransferase SETMAR [Trichonephila clavipes]|nr:histone-lysine N-methyltransferase SETMAR [Trichonephila clavipes]